ncbi:MAG: plasma membrane localization protein [Candelina mexicana]|nr:MAG: plasma membrane localization protein [Candelina mexicana]
MLAVRQACRPKHQVLVLKCYPKFQKNAVDVKPNSSELSYLLYYVSTRRSKVQKVGDFLEKKTASDVWKKKIGNVQITLQILKALIEKSPRDLPLYAPSLLRILSTVLRSKDITLAEYSIPTFATFCAFHDIATLAADQEHIMQYDELITTYAGFASNTPAVQTKAPISTPVALRWRTVGLQAIQSVSASEALGSDGGRQLGLIIPVILQNLYSDNESHLVILQQREQSKEKIDKDQAVKRRMSVSTVRTTDTSDASPVAASGTAAEADKLAEEEVGLLALRGLKKIFEVNNRLQIRMATAAALKFIANKVPLHGRRPESRPKTRNYRGWATTLVEMLARWAPVQDRFVILVTAMETLVRSPVTEENLEQQLVLINLTSWLLSSKINLIGLSVMDVLLGLIQHVLLLLQLGGSESNVLPHPQQTEAVGAEKVILRASEQPLLSEKVDFEVVKLPSALRKEVLLRLQNCIGDLATHIYYSDQISDMLSAILLRLKPPSNSGLANAVIAIEHPAAAAHAVSNSANLHEKRDTDVFFSFDTARVTALNAIKEILVAANIRSSVAGAAAMGRNRVRVQVWDGTQWLLRDTNGEVRKAYVDALLTWLKLEISESDLRVLEDVPKEPKALTREEKNATSGSNLARRAISSASQREKPSRAARSTFLQLLHLAIYDNVIDHAESEPDILLLHLLLTQLIERLGINAVKRGLPMIMRLQEDIPAIKSPTAKVRIGSVVHGYFWALSEKFDFDVSSAGREIHSEIMRRRNKGLWVETVRLPPLSLEHINVPDNFPVMEENHLPTQIVEAEALRPFDNRESMVELIAVAYAESFESSPGSPPASPGRKLSVSPFTSRNTSGAHPMPVQDLPAEIKEQMLSDWCKEDIIANIERASSKAVSLNGSRSGTNNSGARNLLAVNGVSGNNLFNGRQSPQPHQHPQISRPTSIAYGLVGGGFGALHKARRASAHEGSPPPISSSSRSSIVRIDELKKVLSGSAGPTGPTRRWQEYIPTDDSSDSMLSGEASTSEVSLAAGGYGNGTGTVDYAADNGLQKKTPLSSQDGAHPARFERSESSTPKPASSTPVTAMLAKYSQRPDNDDVDAVPPVPPIPASISRPGALKEESRQSTFSDAVQTFITAPQTPADLMSDPTTRKSSLKKSKSSSRRSQSGSREDRSWRSRHGGRADLGGFLKGIEVNEEGIGKGVSKPPY